MIEGEAGQVASEGGEKKRSKTDSCAAFSMVVLFPGLARSLARTSRNEGAIREKWAQKCHSWNGRKNISGAGRKTPGLFCRRKRKVRGVRKEAEINSRHYSVAPEE